MNYINRGYYRKNKNTKKKTSLWTDAPGSKEYGSDIEMTSKCIK